MSSTPTSSAPSPRDLATGRYLLGDAQQELDRLGAQHSLWRDRVLEGWRIAGIQAGSRVVDVGAGPGYATADLVGVVGERGSVTAVERSNDFVQTLQAQFSGSRNVQVHQVDLMTDAIPIASGAYDTAWCRWVAMFVPDIDRLVACIATSLRVGGVAIFHEYCNYQTYATLPRRVEVEEFVTRAIAGLTQCGGTVNAAGPVITALARNGLELMYVRPLAIAARTTDPMWHWPAGFIRTFSPRLVSLGLADDAWVERVFRAVDEAERDPSSVFIGPLNLEIVARRVAPTPPSVTPRTRSIT